MPAATVAPVTGGRPGLPGARIAGIAVSGVATLSILTWAGIAVAGSGEASLADDAADPPSTPAPEYVTELEALEHALMAARKHGLTGDFAHISRRITLYEYADAAGEGYRARQGLLEAPSDTEVWAVAFAGDIRAGLSTGDTVEYDNVTVVLDAITGRVYRVEAFYGDFESPARAPVWLRPPATATPTSSAASAAES